MAADFITIRADAARAQLGSDLVIAGGWAFVSNVLPIDPANDRTPLPEQVEAQTRKVLANFDAIVKAKGLSRDQVVAVRIAVADLLRFEERMDGLCRLLPRRPLAGAQRHRRRQPAARRAGCDGFHPLSRLIGGSA
jgi:enamine deaminase RidA (YjgF/YER057c/UK114 family)